MPRDKSIFSSPVSSGHPLDSTVGKGLSHTAKAHQTTHKNMKRKKEEDKAAGSSCMEEGRLVLSYRYTVIFEIGFTPEHSHFMF